MSDDNLRATAGSWWKEPEQDDAAQLRAELAKARQQIAELKRERDGLLLRVGIALSPDQRYTWQERATRAEQQLAEARAQGMREAAEIARRHETGGGINASVCVGRLIAAIDRAAEVQKAHEPTS